MQRALEFHDSVIATAINDQGGLIVDISPGYVHESDGSPGISPVKGYCQDVRLRFAGVTLGGADLLSAIGTISDGSISVDGKTYENMLPIPLACAGEVVATFVLAESGTRLVFAANAFDASAHGEARYIEDF